MMNSPSNSRSRFPRAIAQFSRHLCIAMWSVMLMVWNCSAEGTLTAEQSKKMVSDFDFVASVKRSEIETQHSDQRKELIEQYVKAVENLALEFQSSGNLESLLVAREEISHAREKLTPGVGELSGLTPLREILSEKLAAIDVSEASSVAKLIEREVPELEALKVALTKGGQLDDAISVQKKIDERKAVLESRTPSKPGAVKEIDPADELPALEIPGGHKDGIEESASLKRGRYDLRHQRIKIGVEGKSKADVTVEAGSAMEDGEIFVTAGSFTADRCFFDEIKFSADLNAPMTYSDSLFQECTFTKGGGWFVKVFSSKWTFNNCVFSGTFVEPWKAGGVGVKIMDCTFIDVDFAEVIYREDAALEAKHDWMTIKNCEFVRCKVPESVLIATEDCVFTDCRFATGRYPASQTLSATIFTAGSTPTEVKTSSNAIITTKPAGEKAGATIDYDYNSGRLRAVNR